MKRNSIVFSLTLALLTLAVTAVAQDKKSESGGPAAGTWQCTAHGGPNGDLPFSLYLEQKASAVTGSVSSALGDADIVSATFANGALEIHINGGDENYVLSGKLANGQFTGEWSTDGGDKGTWEGKKGADAPADAKPAGASATPPASQPAAKPQ